MIFVLSLVSIAVFYSAWYLNLPIFSSEWCLYCIAWLPLIMIFVSAYKYDNKNKSKQSSTNAATTYQKYSRSLHE